MPNPAEVYRARRDGCVSALQRAEARSVTIARLRLASFGALAVLAWLGLDGHIALAWSLLPLAGFVALVIRHEREHRRIDRARRGVAHYDGGLQRIAGEWGGRGNPRTDLVPADHPYARDLDLFGEGSLFERLCTARTAAGERVLASWLLAPAAIPTLQQRRVAVDALRPAVALREELAIAGADLRAAIDPGPLARWGTAPPLVDAAGMRRIAALAWLLPVVAAATLGLWATGASSGAPAALVIAALWGFHRHTHAFVQRTDAAIERPARELGVVAELLARLEREPFAAPRLLELRGLLVHGDDSAAARVRALCRRAEWLQTRRSAVFAPLAWLLCWGEHFTLSIERWRLRHGPHIDAWFDALGELEALAALAAYAFEHPDDVWPELVDGAAVVEGTGLRHPLLPGDRCVANDVALGEPTRALMISGSNMAGKSTYMRTVGVNVVLALAGAPVHARALRLTPVQLGASIRIEDSLRGGTSRFYAEITRLRQIAALTADPLPVLFLLDEVLHGTNSNDRRVGASALLLRLVDAGALGMMTTHDLALATDVEPLAPRIRNVHFADELDGAVLVFDYRLREGIVQTSNALALMRAVGLHV